MTEAQHQFSEARPGARLREVPLVSSSFPLTVSSVLYLARIRSLKQTQKIATMKFKYAIIALLSSILFFSGCSTVGNAPDLARVKTSAKLAAYIGSTEYMRANPVSRPGFALAVEALKEIEAAPTVDLTTLLAVVNRLPTKDIRSERVQMLITSTTILLSDFGGTLPLERMAELRPVATAIREGVELALK